MFFFMIFDSWPKVRKELLKLCVKQSIDTYECDFEQIHTRNLVIIHYLKGNWHLNPKTICLTLLILLTKTQIDTFHCSIKMHDIKMHDSEKKNYYADSIKVHVIQPFLYERSRVLSSEKHKKKYSDNGWHRFLISSSNLCFERKQY